MIIAVTPSLKPGWRPPYIIQTDSKYIHKIFGELVAHIRWKTMLNYNACFSIARTICVVPCNLLYRLQITHGNKLMFMIHVYRVYIIGLLNDIVWCVNWGNNVGVIILIRPKSFFVENKIFQTLLAWKIEEYSLPPDNSHYILQISFRQVQSQICPRIL